MLSWVDVQVIIDDLDFAATIFDGKAVLLNSEFVQEVKDVRLSLKAASEILTHLPEGTIEKLPNYLRR